GLVLLGALLFSGAVRARLTTLLPGTLRVLTHRELIDFERDSWSTLAPIGYIFNFGVFMGLFVGLVIVYQILFADVTDHLPEYATLKAIGFSSSYLVGVVLRQSLYLAVLGYLPGLLITLWLYHQARVATGLQLYLTSGRALLVLSVTLIMCGVSGALAVQKVRTTDPADIF
ncbi:MAG TPA: ABC transporter, partial [bacterium]|nr:ABC transporter [bacterium]